MSNEEEVETLGELLDAARQKAATWNQRAQELSDRMLALEIADLDIPTEPGIYLTEDGYVAHLTTESGWDDGWDNGWEDVGELVGARRLIPEEPS